MRRRIRCLLFACALALPAVAADAQGPRTARPVRAAPPDASVEPAEQPRRGGLFATVLRWFRGDAEEETPPAPGSVAPEPEAESGSMAVPEPEAESGSMAVPEPEAELEVTAVPEPVTGLEVTAVPEPVTGLEAMAVPEPVTEREAAAKPEPAAESKPAPTNARARLPAADDGTATLAQVHRAVRDLIAEIGVLRRANGVTGELASTEPGEGYEAPIHAYLKSLEVMEKAARVQRRFGMISFEVAPMPAGNVAVEDTYRNVLTAVEELRRVKRQLVIRARIEPAPLVGDDPAPALVHAHLADASALLDGLVGRPVSSNDVYMHVLRVRGAMQPLAASLGVVFRLGPPVEETTAEAKTPKETAQQILIATYKVINLQSRLGMTPSNVPDALPGDVTPAAVYEVANRLLVELARIKAHLDIESPVPERYETRRMQSGDVYAQMLRLIADLDRMSKAVAGRN